MAAAVEQQVVPQSVMNGVLGPTAMQEQTVPLLLRLELGRQQLADISEQAFALIAAESVRRQQHLLQEAAAVADGSSTEGSTCAPGESGSIADHPSTAENREKAAAKVAPMPAAAAAAASDAQLAAPAAGSSDTVSPAAAAALKPIAYHMEIQGPDGETAQHTSIF
jgi:hypothetical protein